MARTYVFGVFEFCPLARQLRKHGAFIKLEPQAAKLLALLLEQPGKFVSDEEIRKRLWGSITVDHDSGIRRALYQLRVVLGGDAKKSIYIKRDRGLGCQFIAPVTVSELEADAPPESIVRERKISEDREDPLLAARSESPNERIAPIVFPSHIHPDPSLVTPVSPSPTVLAKKWAAPWRAYRNALLLGVVVALGGTLAVTASLAGAYGLAILALVPVIAFSSLGFLSLPDSAYTRAAIALLTLSAMSYMLSASTLPEVLASVVNMETLTPALVYPVVTGLKFMPLFPLVFGYWLLLGGFAKEDHAKLVLRRIYDCLGPCFLSATWICGAWFAGDYRIYEDKVPGRSVLIAGYVFIYALNIALWFLARRLLIGSARSSYCRLLALSWITFFPLALASYAVDHQYNQINRHFLDKRRPAAYVVANPDAIDQSAFVNTNREIGPDLLVLLKSPEFKRAIHTEKFYKEDFDEAFQMLDPSIMFGFEVVGGPSSRAAPTFEMIRFPRSLAEALQFQLVRSGQ